MEYELEPEEKAFMSLPGYDALIRHGWTGWTVSGADVETVGIGCKHGIICIPVSAVEKSEAAVIMAYDQEYQRLLTKKRDELLGELSVVESELANFT